MIYALVRESKKVVTMKALLKLKLAFLKSGRMMKTK
jgi:hypothetical protein